MPRHGRRRSPLFYLAISGLLCLSALELGLAFGPASGKARKVEITIPRGASISSVARRLQRRGAIRSAAAFVLIARLQGSPRIPSGVYLVSPNHTPAAILHDLGEGSGERMVRVTIPEGFTLEQMANRLSDIPGVDADEFQTLVSESGKSFHAAVPLPANLEGFLFPDTYDFRPNVSARCIAEHMLANFDHKVAKPLAGDFKAAAARGMSVQQVITLASLVEREAKVPRDQPLIAGVLVNRLNKGMPLQVDATVQYVIGHRERLLYRDLRVNSPYNTYQHTGLPPAPICNPGLPAIRAALHPAAVPYLYYTARPDGSHAFSMTLADHNRATAVARAGRRL